MQSVHDGKYAEPRFTYEERIYYYLTGKDCAGRPANVEKRLKSLLTLTERPEHWTIADGSAPPAFTDDERRLVALALPPRRLNYSRIEDLTGIDRRTASREVERCCELLWGFLDKFLLPREGRRGAAGTVRLVGGLREDLREGAPLIDVTAEFKRFGALARAAHLRRQGGTPSNLEALRRAVSDVATSSATDAPTIGGLRYAPRGTGSRRTVYGLDALILNHVTSKLDVFERERWKDYLEGYEVDAKDFRGRFKGRSARDTDFLIEGFMARVASLAAECEMLHSAVQEAA